MDAKERSKKQQSRTVQKSRSRLINRFVVFSVTLFLVILVVGSAAFIFSMRQIIRTNKGNELSRMLEIKQIELEMSVNNEIALVLKMAGSPLIQGYFASPYDHELKRLAFEEIAAYRDALASNSVFWVNDIDKLFYFDDNEPYLVDPTTPDNYWYPMTLYETERYNFNINYNPDLNVTNLWINAPVFDNEHKPVGMVGTGIDLSTFIDMLYRNYMGSTELYFFNASGEITGSRNIRLVTAKHSIEDELAEAGIDILAMFKSLKPGEIQTFDVKDGKVAVGTVPVLEWYSAAFMPDSINDYKTAMSALFLAMLVLILLIFVIFNVFIAGFLKSLQKTMDSLEIASKAKSDFLAKMSHEIRTPMNAIIGMTELALRENIPPAASEHIITVKQSCANLMSIINDILDFSKIESGKLEIIPGNYLISSLIGDVVSIVRTRFVDSQVKFVVNIDCNMPNELFGDEIRIRQILLNILSNAVKYTEKGFVSFAVIGEIIDESAVNLKIEIADSGKGIKPEGLEILFGEFVQIDLERNKGVEGTGLGLAITRSLVKAMGGDISVSSEYGVGSTFTAILPQKIRSRVRVASVEKSDEKRVLVYELRKIYADSIMSAMDGLGVECTLVSTDSELYEKMEGKAYSFVFIASSLYENVRARCSELISNATIVLLTEFGEAIAERNLKTLAMPVYSISAASILNGVPNNFNYGLSKETVVRFTAPEAMVLVVDDIKTNLIVVKGLMSPYKMHVKLCNSGIKAIEEIKSNRYDLVFMDHMMPEMDGIEATRHIRSLSADDVAEEERSYYKRLPIVALTANAVSGTREMFLENGFDDFVSKPIDTVHLNTVLEKWIPKEKQEKFTG